METLGYISALCFFIGYIPQLVRTYRLKSVDDISLWMWVITLLAYASGLSYGIYLNKNALILSYTLGLGCTAFMLLMYSLYRDPRKDKARRIVAGFISESQRKLKEKDDE